MLIPSPAPHGQTGRPTISVVVPCLNEERNLPYVFSRMPRDIDEIVLVDGGSTDGTVRCAQQLWPSVVVVQQTRRGKGNALACGFAACTGDIVVMLDADGSTDPAEIPQFVRALVDGADFAKGSRFLPGGGSADITRLRRLGNSGLSGLVNLLFKTEYSDLCYGYNAFWRGVLPYMDLPDVAAPRPADGRMLWGDGFEVETLINIRVAMSRLSITEVPSVEARRLHGVSNLNAYSDGVRVLSIIRSEFKQRPRSRRVAPTVAPTGAPAPASGGNPVTLRPLTPVGGAAHAAIAARVGRDNARDAYTRPRGGQHVVTVNGDHGHARRDAPSTRAAAP